MTSFVSAIGIFLIYLNFVPFPCEGIINLPPRGDTFIVDPGTARVEIAWTFNDTIDVTTVRQWEFLTTGKVLGAILGNGNVAYVNSSLPGYEIIKPATLVLKNVDDRYNGMYEFSINTVTLKSSVTVFIAAKPTAIINCSSSVVVNEGDDLRCICKGEGGNPPANATWYKDGVQIGVAGDQAKILTLNNVNKTTSGTYKCVAQSHNLKTEDSIRVAVHYKPNDPMVVFSQNPARLNKQIVISCEADGLPEPNYIIIHNETEFSHAKSRTIQSVKYSDGGSYKCFANNTLGNVASDTKYLNVTDLHKVTTIASTTPTDSPNTEGSTTVTCNKSNCGTEWYLIVVTLVSGIVVGILLSYLFVYSRRRFKRRKHQSNPEPETSKVNSIYQDLDLRKMNSEDNYQSLRVNSGRNEADYESQNDSTYTELNAVRDVENSYQSLT